MRDVHRGGVPADEARSLLSRPLVWLVQLYQRTVSPLLGPVCRYYPSCSAYSVTALERYGPLRGTWMTGLRLLRCNPWAQGGVDHVPAREGAGPPHTHSGPAHEDRHRDTPPVGRPHRRD